MRKESGSAQQTSSFPNFDSFWSARELTRKKPTRSYTICIFLYSLFYILGLGVVLWSASFGTGLQNPFFRF